ETIEGKNVIIRAYKESDIDLLYAAVRESIHELSVWMPWCSSEYSIDESSVWVKSRKKAWDEKEEYSFVVEHQKTGKFLGAVGLNHIDEFYRIANLGYWMRTSETGKGYSTEAALLAAKFGFQKLNLNRIEIVIGVGNNKSQKVAEKIHALKECVARNRIIINDGPVDAFVYSLIREDLKNGSKY
ncbi:MAG: GNAT family protein, partial [Ignavibacteriaceae bacterium]